MHAYKGTLKNNATTSWEDHIPRATIVHGLLKCTSAPSKTPTLLFYCCAPRIRLQLPINVKSDTTVTSSTRPSKDLRPLTSAFVLLFACLTSASFCHDVNNAKLSNTSWNCSTSRSCSLPFVTSMALSIHFVLRPASMIPQSVTSCDVSLRRCRWRSQGSVQDNSFRRRWECPSVALQNPHINGS